MSTTVREDAANAAAPERAAGGRDESRWLVRLLGPLLVVVISIVLALGLGEIAIRIVAPQHLIVARPDVWAPVDTLGHAKVAGIATILNQGPRPVQFYTDSLGFRVGANGQEPGKKRVLILGDSFMEAREVEYEESVAGLLDSTLTTELGYPIEVWNTGVSDWGPSHYLLQAKRLLGTYEFDVVLLSIFVGNDVMPRKVEYFPPRAPRMRHRFHVPKRLSASAVVEGVLYPMNDFLEERSHLFLFLKYRLRAVLMGFGLTADYFPFSLLRSEANSTSWEVTAEICREIADLAREQGLETVVVIIPAIQQIDWKVATVFLEGFQVDSSAVDIDQPNRILVGKLRERGLDVVDVLPAFRQAHQNGTTLYETVGWHLERDGHRIVNDLLWPVLAERLRN